MPHGFFTIEQWKRPSSGAEPQWLLVQHLTGCRTLTDAIKHLEQLDQPGFYRVQQTQRMIWAEKTDGKLRLRKWHAGLPETLARSAEAFERDGGRWPATPTHPRKPRAQTTRRAGA
jgi:hypothetical protein